jgi:broad specificity phosphatase PhoE
MTKVISFVLNLRRRSLRPIYMCRHGGTDNTGQVVGTDFGLSEIGCNFADALNQYLATEIHQPEVSLTVWCSTAKRARTTSKHINSTRQVEWRALRDLDAGVFDGLSYERIQEQYPKEAAARKANKLNYRYPRGESYMDVISRLEPVIFELERQEGPVLIVAHQAVLRCLYSYYLDLPQEGVPYLSVPLHTLIRLEPETFGCKEKRLKFTLQQDNPLNVRGRTMSDAPPSSHG